MNHIERKFERDFIYLLLGQGMRVRYPPLPKIMHRLLYNEYVTCLCQASVHAHIYGGLRMLWVYLSIYPLLNC